MLDHFCIIIIYYKETKINDVIQWGGGGYQLLWNWLWRCKGEGVIYVMDGSDMTSSAPSSVLHLKVDKGQGLWYGVFDLIQSCTTIIMKV